MELSRGCDEGSYPALELTPVLLVTGGGLAACYNVGQMYAHTAEYTESLTAYESCVRDSHMRIV